MRDWVVTSVDVSVEPKAGWDCVVAAGAEVRQPVHGIQLTLPGIRTRSTTSPASATSRVVMSTTKACRPTASRQSRTCSAGREAQ